MQTKRGGLKKKGENTPRPQKLKYRGDLTIEISSARKGFTYLAITEPLSLKASWRKGQRIYRKVGWGEFEPADRTRSIEFMRYLFLEQIRETEFDKGSKRSTDKKLKVLEELSGVPLNEFEKAGVNDQQINCLFANPYGSFVQELLPLQKSVLTWAKRWNLNAAWCLSAAFSTLMLWRDYPEARKRFIWDNNFPLDSATQLLPKEVTINAPFTDLPPFYAHIELRTVYIRRARLRINRHIKTDPFTAKLSHKLQRSILKADLELVSDYCDQVMRAYKRQRDSKNTHVWKLVSERADLFRDVRWAVEYQVQGVSARSIAQKDNEATDPIKRDQGLPHSTVTRAVTYVLSLIGLPKRTRSSRPTSS